MKSLDKEDLAKAVFLLEESVYVMCKVPRKKKSNGYVKSFEDTYELASNIEKFLNTIKDGTERKS